MIRGIYVGVIIMCTCLSFIALGIYDIAKSVKHMDKVITEQFRME